MFEIEIGPFQSTDIKFRLSAFQNCKEFPQKMIFWLEYDFFKNPSKLQKKSTNSKLFYINFFIPKNPKFAFFTS